MFALRVLFLSRSNLTTVPAGDTIQVLNTKRALEKLGVQVELKKHPPEGHFRGDLVHLFNTIPIQDVYAAYHWAKRHGLPVILSTIYWDAAGWISEAGLGEEGLKRQEWWQRTQPLRREVIGGAHLLLPNAEGELAKIRSDFGFAELPYRVVPNAADPIYLTGRAQAFRRRFKLFGDFVFCAARIDARKNQLALIDALADTAFQVVFAGPGGDSAYFCSFQKRLGEKIRYLGSLSPRVLADVYAAARVHALVSWYDTPGLASLEAGLAGCRLVSTNRGTAREYLGDAAFYCDPGDPEDIRQTVLRAWRAPVPVGLKQRILAEYNWDRVGRLTLAAYQEVLG
ncbi:MAG: glycosyltransferase family 4 protein [Firmicutes bacterium]|nr:glycosyltransferase family 4 protein [Bacillota bacterium]